MGVAIEARNLTKRYNGIVAVDRVGFEVREGEIFGFLGPNGAGKTTTIRMITGLVKPDEGTAYVAGYDILKEPVKARQHLGVVPEVSNAYIDLTAWENIVLIGKLYGLQRSVLQENAVRLLREFGLYHVKNRAVRSFSKGMKQRLLLCMALVSEPEILILDEPTSGLDVESARFLREKIVQYNREGGTVFLSTHNMEEANMLCHRVAIINRGRIVTVDTPENLRARITELQRVEVVFDKHIELGELLKIRAARRALLAGCRVRIYTPNPPEVIESIVDFARERGLRILSLNTAAPSLEDVFLELVKGGRRGEPGRRAA